jgi:hypothetical protein
VVPIHSHRVHRWPTLAPAEHLADLDVPRLVPPSKGRSSSANLVASSRVKATERASR